MIDKEASAECGRVYLTYLHLYLEFYTMLSPRERECLVLAFQGLTARESLAPRLEPRSGYCSTPV